MGKAGKNDMLQAGELLADGPDDTRVGVAKQIDPPGGHGVDIGSALPIVEVNSLTTVDKDGRMGLVILHLGAGMPDAHGVPPGTIRHEHVLFRKIHRSGGGGAPQFGQLPDHPTHR